MNTTMARKCICSAGNPALFLLVAMNLAQLSGCNQQAPDRANAGRDLSVSGGPDLGVPGSDTRDLGMADRPPMLRERPLSIDLTLSGTALHIYVHDGPQSVMTDVWLYTLSGSTPIPLTGFADPPTKRKSRRLLLPCTLSGVPSGLAPCDTGVENGLMTDLVRETLANGVYKPAIKGTADVVLSSAPTSPVLVVAAVEDQRYAGAAAIDPSGNPVAVPAGLGVPEIHVARTYAKDIAPMLTANCQGCHGSTGIASLHRIASYEDVVQRNIAFAEAQKTCLETYPMDAAMELACEQAITRVSHLVEPGAPAISNLARRCRPDELQSQSPMGLLWYGSSGGSRFDKTGDRRMPSTDLSPVVPDMGPLPASQPTYFDKHPEEYQVLFDWIAQGALP